MLILVRSAGGDDTSSFKFLQLFDIDMVRIAAFQFSYFLRKKIIDSFLITVSSLLADTDNLSLKSISKHGADIVVEHIGSLFVNDFLRFEISSDRVFTENLQLLFIIEVPEDVDKGVVHGIVIGDFAVRSTTFVFDFHDNAIFFSLPHGIGVNVASEVIDSFGNRSTRKCHLDRVRHTLPHIRSQFGILGTVRLVNHDKDAVARVQNRECGNGSPLLQRS